MLTDPLADRISLKRRVLSAGTWSFIGYGLSQVTRLGSNLVMTRLLVPSMFGVMAIATVIMVGLNFFTDLGLRVNIIQSKRGSDPAFLNTAWATQIFRSALLWFGALGIAFLLPVIDDLGILSKDNVYADPHLPYVIGVLSFSFIIGGFNSTKTIEANRNLALGRVTLIQLAASIGGLACMLIWAFFDRSIWALVSGNICTRLIQTTLSHTHLPGTPNRWHWDETAFWEIFHFGKWLFLSSILAFLASNGDRLMLGGMISTTVLGVYVVAFMIVSSIEQVLSMIMGSVVFPAFSEIARERPSALKETYSRLRLVVTPLIYLGSGILITAGPTLIRLLYDPRYAGAGSMLRILAFGIATVPFQMAIQCFLALGRPQLNSHIQAVRLVALFTAMPLGFHFFGLPGALWGSVFSQFLTVPIIVIYSVQHGILDLRKELLLLPTIAVGAGIGEIFSTAVGY